MINNNNYNNNTYPMYGHHTGIQYKRQRFITPDHHLPAGPVTTVLHAAEVGAPVLPPCCRHPHLVHARVLRLASLCEYVQLPCLGLIRTAEKSD